MKKILLFVFAALLAYTMSAQITSFPYTQGFENGLDGWQATSMNTANSTLFGVVGSSSGATPHSGDSLFIFNSYSEADDYTQYLISPELTLTGAGELHFYHRAGSSYSEETFQIMTSTTTSDISSFSNLGAEVTSPIGTYTEAVVALSADVKYVAIKYTSNYLYYIFIDDITINMASTTPEIELLNLTTQAVTTEGSSVTVSGTVRNNSAVALTSFDVNYTLDGVAAGSITIDGLNVAFGETATFSHTTPAVITAGDHTVVVTVSNPNGTADNTADNSLSMNVMGCSAVTALPFTETFDDGSGCFTMVDADNDGHNWMTMGEWLISRGSSSDPGTLCYGGTGNAMVSESWSTSDGALTPDNWLISPAIVLPSTGTYGVTWYAKSQDADYPDNYSVYVGTSNDIAALGATTPVYSGTAEVDEFAQHAAMLDTYAGQTVYVAFRHHNVSDKFVLIIDQFQVSEVSVAPEIALTEASAPTSTGTNTAFAVSGIVVNNCASPLTSFDAACTVNGQTYNQQFTGLNVEYLQTYNFSVNVPGIATTGDFDITLTVSNPNGTADVTTDNTQNTSINIYDASAAVDRTVLLENFTGAWCQYCPSGHKAVEEAIEALPSNLRSRVIWVAHHNNDALVNALPNGNPSTIIENAFPIDGFPSAMLDRTVWDGADGFEGTPIYHPGYTTASLLQTAMQTPAFVTVNISNVNYNASSRTLTATVSGNVSSDLGTTDARLNVWLMEDGLVADGQSGVGHGPAQSDAYNLYDPFIHNNVIRANLTGDAWGEASIVTPTAGTNYTKNISTTISSNYDASKCYLVAFVSKGDHSNTNNAPVYNAAKSDYFTTGGGSGPGVGIDDVNAMNVNLYPNPTTGNLYIDVEGLEKVEVIDMVGRVVMTQENGNTVNLSNLANGVYSVRISANGNTAVKRVVKK